MPDSKWKNTKTATLRGWAKDMLTNELKTLDKKTKAELIALVDFFNGDDDSVSSVEDDDDDDDSWKTDQPVSTLREWLKGLCEHSKTKVPKNLSTMTRKSLVSRIEKLMK